MSADILLFGFCVFSAAVAALIYWVGYCYRPSSWKKVFFKTWAVAFLAIASLFALGPWGLTAALIFCALGDFLLALDREDAFLAGVGAFAVGHVFYIAVILGHGLSDVALLTNSPRSLPILGLIALAAIMAVVLFRRAGDLRFAVVGYVPVIVGLGIAGLTLMNLELLPYAILGAMLFVASDLVLSIEMFIISENSKLRKFTPFFIWGTYWFAQLALLVGLGIPA